MNNRNISALKYLEEAFHEAKKAKYPNVPERCLPKTKYNDKTANGLTKCIIDFIELKGGQAERISSVGNVIDTRTDVIDCIGRIKTVGTIKRVYSTSTNGTADVSATINGKSVKIEIKIKKDTQSEVQKAYQKAIEKAGGIYVIAKDFQSFYEWFVRTFENQKEGRENE